MQIVGLFWKRASGQGVERVQSLMLRQGWGVEGDASAHPGSPRQVLLAGTEALQRFNLQPGDLQENILVEGTVEGLESGQVWQLGGCQEDTERWAIASHSQDEQDNTRQPHHPPDLGPPLIRLTLLCEPCTSLNQLQPGLAKRIVGQRGMLGMVVRGGTVRLGDRIHLTPLQFPAIPGGTRQRFESFIARIPEGHVVRTCDVLLALGLTPSYYRTIPILIKKAPPELPVHRIVAVDGKLLSKHLPDQSELLQSEGILLNQDRVEAAFWWLAENFY